MKVRLWGTRGSIATPGPETTRYGGNTSCVEVRGRDGDLLVLDAGTGIRRLGATIGPEVQRIDLLLTHLHLDHIEGLGFFGPLFRRDLEVHIWGPASTTLDLRARLTRLLSPPLFPVRLRDLPCQLELHDLSSIERFQVGSLEVRSALVCHPGPTVGFRISEGDAALAYLSDHEPAFGAVDFPNHLEWTAGFEIAADADLLIHDAQYDDDEYADRVGWGHSSLRDALAFAEAARARRVIPYHYDPGHTDVELDKRFERAQGDARLPFELLPALEGASFEL
jgi:phosphoribosyl 1,2-cyclic phosphodiesterase